MIEKVCLFCGNPFHVLPYRDKTAKFCSFSCGAKYKWKVGKFKSRPLTEGQKMKISEAHKKRGTIPPSRKGEHHKLSEETKEKMRQVALKDGRMPPSRKGATHSEETKQKLREIRLKQTFHTKDTSIELLLQNELNKRGIEYEKHVTVCNICQPDIVFPERKIVIFADGDYWHNLPRLIRNDERHNKVLIENGWKVFRFWEYEIKESPSRCIDTMLENWDPRVGPDPL